MAYQHYIDKNQNCIFVRHLGEVGTHEFEKQMTELSSLPDFEEGLHLLRDISLTKMPPGHDLTRVKNDILPGMKPIIEALGPRRMVAWVVGNPDDFKVIHQLATIYRLNLNVAERKPFRDIKKAREWLGIPEDYEIKYPDAE